MALLVCQNEKKMGQGSRNPTLRPDIGVKVRSACGVTKLLLALFTKEAVGKNSIVR